jgi:hypothetical protein
VIEKKLAILDFALHHNPNNLELILLQLSLAQRHWDNERIMARWQELMGMYPSNARIWKV